MKNLLINIGAHCTALGMISILLIILTGAISYIVGFSTTTFYYLLGGSFLIMLGASIYCLRCNCSYFNKR